MIEFILTGSDRGQSDRLFPTSTKAADYCYNTILDVDCFRERPAHTAKREALGAARRKGDNPLWVTSRYCAKDEPEQTTVNWKCRNGRQLSPDSSSLDRN